VFTTTSTISPHRNSVSSASGLRASNGFFRPTNGFLPAFFLRGTLSDFFSSQSNGFQQPSNGFKKPLVRCQTGSGSTGLKLGGFMLLEEEAAANATASGSDDEEMKIPSKEVVEEVAEELSRVHYI
jgi:hypothetical protein